MGARIRFLFIALALVTAAPLFPAHAGAVTRTTTTIGYLGCSNTFMTVDGAHRFSGDTRFWPALGSYGNGTVQTWARSIGDTTSRYWATFSRELGSLPTRTFWIELCAKGNETLDPRVLLSEATAVIAEVRRQAPNAVIYVSAINDYVAPHVCAAMPQGAGPMGTLAASLVSSLLAFAGPAMGSLLSIYPTNVSLGATAANDETVLDGCHPNDLGERHLGARLKAFIPFAG